MQIYVDLVRTTWAVGRLMCPVWWAYRAGQAVYKPRDYSREWISCEVWEAG